MCIKMVVVCYIWCIYVLLVCIFYMYVYCYGLMLKLVFVFGCIVIYFLV